MKCANLKKADDYATRKEARARLTSEHKLYIMNFVSRQQSNRLTAAEVRDELHRAFGFTQTSYFSVVTIRVALKRLGFSYRKSSVRPPLAIAPRNLRQADTCR